MVYTARDHGPDRGVTVIWIFASDTGGERAPIDDRCRSSD